MSIFRTYLDVLGFVGIFVVVGSKKEPFVEVQKVKILDEIISVHQQVEVAAQQLLSSNLLKSPNKQINTRDWVEFLEKIFSSDLNGELQSVRLKDLSAPPTLQTPRGKLETFSSEELDEILSFKSATSGESPSLHHPLTQILCVLPEVYQKHKVVNGLGSKKYNDFLHYGMHSQLSPDQAVVEELKTGFIRVAAISSFFYLSTKALYGMKAEVPIFQPLTDRFARVSESVLGKRWSLLRSGGRWMLGLLAFPLAWGVMNWNDERIKKSKMTDWLYRDKIQSLSSKAAPKGLDPRDPKIITEAPELILSFPISFALSFIGDDDDDADKELKEDVPVAVKPTQRPLCWEGAALNDPITIERAKISLLFKPLFDAVLFYGILLKHLLSYSNPVLAHLLTAVAYVTVQQEGKPDLINVLQNLPPAESGLSFYNRTLIQQLLFHVSGGSVFLPFVLEMMHVGQYFMLKELPFSLPVYPIELSHFSSVFLLVSSWISGVITRLPPKQGYFDRKQLLSNFFSTPEKLILHPTVLREVPNAKEIIHQFSKDIFLLYSSDHFSDKHLQTLSHNDLCNCIVRLEHYKKHFLPADKTLPLWFIDEEVIRRLLSVVSPERLERMSEERKSSGKSQTAYEQLSGEDEHRGELKDRSSYMRIMQPALSELPLKDFVDAVCTPSSLSHETKTKAETQSSSTMISALQENHLHASFPFVTRLYYGFIRINYPSGKISQTEFERFLTSYLNTIEPHTLIEELKKMEQALNKEHHHEQQQQQLEDRQAGDQKRASSVVPSDLYSHMRYYEDLLVNGAKKKEELLDIIQEFYSSIMKADEMMINGMEPMLLYELRSSLLGRSVSHLRRVPPNCLPQSPEFNKLPVLEQVMLRNKQVFVSEVLIALSVSRHRCLESVLYKHGLTLLHFTELVRKYAEHYPEVKEVAEAWGSYFDPTPLPVNPDEPVWSIKYADSNNYPDRLKKLLIKDDAVRKIIYDDVTIGAISSLKGKKHEQKKEG